MTLKELIESKGYKQKFIVEKLNEKEVEISEPHFSRVCNGHNKPRGDRFYKHLSKIIGVSVSDIKKCFDD